ncbi:glucose-1-phosphate adenylyltransferase [candidate division KSB1 bacterium]|nr:glucose-1-phosphate adenylyltransferase [candidate division KSB1 bacterium]
MDKILAMLLAGGRVDDLDVLTLFRPKSALPFGGMFRIIDFPLSNLLYSKIERVGILLQYRSSSLITHIGNGSAWDMIGRNRGIFVLPPYIAASSSNWYNGTADAIHQNFDFIDEFDPEHVLILSGDHIYKMDYAPLIDFHQSKNADMTAVFTKVNINSAHRFGLAELDDEAGEMGGRLLKYWEKPKKPIADWASLTIYLFKTSVLKQVLNEIEQEDITFEFGRDIIPRMIDRFKVYGFKFHGYWGYTRTFYEYWKSNMDTLGENPKIDIQKWGVRTNLDHREIRDRIPTKISADATIENSLISPGCEIEGTVINSILFPGVIVEKGATVKDSIIMFDSHIQNRATLERAILDTDIIVGKYAHIGYSDAIQHDTELTVIGQKTFIPDHAKIKKNKTISPNLPPNSIEAFHKISGVNPE